VVDVTDVEVVDVVVDVADVSKTIFIINAGITPAPITVPPNSRTKRTFRNLLDLEQIHNIYMRMKYL